MGGRGSSSGISVKGKKYGTEFTTLHQSGNIKFIRYNDSKAATPPMETMTSGRIYAVVNNKNEVKFINTYDKQNKRNRQIDVIGRPHKIDGENVIPHVHVGYDHKSSTTEKLSVEDKKILEKTLKIWQNKNSK